MRHGFTTGSCAAAASKAAAYMLLFGKDKNSITITTPKGLDFKAEILETVRGEKSVKCAVRKDGGDDPDVTTGALIFAEVSVSDTAGISIDGGVGVGRVTARGLDQPVGNAAINHVPREMIEKEVREIVDISGYEGGLDIIISVPEGEEIAKRTFNPRLGIVGGISIIGTSGVVEPMSKQAIIDTIRVELNMKKEEGYSTAFISPGNYGLDFMKSAYGYDLDRSVKCSNFIGETIDAIVELGFESVLLTGHIGKLIKVAGGIMNTHSRESDSRMELIAAFASKYGASSGEVNQILDCLTTEEALSVVKNAGILQDVMNYAVSRIIYYLDKRAMGKLKIECILYSNDFGELAKSDKALELLEGGMYGL